MFTEDLEDLENRNHECKQHRGHDLIQNLATCELMHRTWAVSVLTCPYSYVVCSARTRLECSDLRCHQIKSLQQPRIISPAYSFVEPRCRYFPPSTVSAVVSTCAER